MSNLHRTKLDLSDLVMVMTKNIIDIDKYRHKEPQHTVDEAIKRAVKELFDPRLDSLEEPIGLASGNTSVPGKFIIDDNEIDDGDIHEKR